MEDEKVPETFLDWFRMPDEDNSLTFRSYELLIFVLVYVFSVILILVMFESVRPVLFNPEYPNYPS